nr:hypothetical protein [Tanacetum cinerariifolium]
MDVIWTIQSFESNWVGPLVSFGRGVDRFGSSNESVGSSPSQSILFGTIPAKIPVETPTIPHDPYEVYVAHCRVAARSSTPSSPTNVTPPTIYQILPAPPGLPRRPTAKIPVETPTIPHDPYEVYVAHCRVAARSSTPSSPTNVTPPTLYQILPAPPGLPRRPTDHFSSDDSSSDSSSDYSSNSSSGHSLPDSSVDAPATISADIDVDNAAAEAVAAKEADVGVEVGIGIDREDGVESEDKGTIKIGVDRVTKPVVSDDVYESACNDMPESTDERGLDGLMQKLYDHLVEIRLECLDRDKMKLRGMLCVERERIDSLRCHMAYINQEELRQIRRFRYYDRMEFRRLETYARICLGDRP